MKYMKVYDTPQPKMTHADTTEITDLSNLFRVF